MRLPGSAQRIIHLHQAKPEMTKPLHEKGVGRMLELMEKTRKRYWHEELANCLGHVLDKELLPSGFGARLALQALERVKGSERLSAGELEALARGAGEMLEEIPREI